MATALELCAQLGFLDTSHEGPSRGLPKVLLDDMKNYAKDRQFVKDATLIANAYLYVANAGEKHWPSAEIPQWGFPAWGVDNRRIRDLVVALFGLIMNSERTDRVVIDLEEDDTMTSNEGIVQQVGGFQTLPSEELDWHASEAGTSAIVVSQVPGPITRLARKDPDLIWNLLHTGHTEPFPIVAGSEADLVMNLNEWIGEHPGGNPPGAVPLRSQLCGYKHLYKNELTFACTSEHVWVERFKINQNYMGWILTEADGSCMLVEADYGNRRGWRGYYGWLGADLGFTYETVAYTGIWDPVLEKYVGHSVAGIKGQDQVLEPGMQPGEHGCGKLLVEAAKKPSQRTHESVEVDSVMIKKGPSRSGFRRAAVRQNQIERETDEQRWRSGTPPLSSLHIVKKFRWPPQYKSPPPTSRHRELRLPSTMKPQTAGAAPVALRNLRDRSSSLEVISAGAANASPGTRRSTRSNCSITFMNDYPLVFNTPPKKLEKRGTKSQAPVPSGPTSTPNQASSLESTVPAKVVFHFFLADESLGALPVPFAQCDTVDKFFEQAAAAWAFLATQDEHRQIAGVMVTLEGFQWPIIIVWKDSHGYQWVIDTVSKATIGRMNDLHVQVKCAMK